MGRLLSAAVGLAAPGAVGPLRAAARLHGSIWSSLGQAALKTTRRAREIESALRPGDAAIWRAWAAYSIAATGTAAAAILCAASAPGVAIGGAILSVAATLCAISVARESWLARGRRGGWLPPSPPPRLGDGEWKVIVSFITGAMLAFAPLIAGAAGITIPSATTTTTMGATIIAAIFPPASNPWATALGALNSTLSAGGGLLLGWHTVAGMIASAHEGKLLGQKYHSIWAPLRILIGFSMLTPVPNGGGLNGAELALSAAATASSTLADSIWSAFVSSSLGTSTAAADGDTAAGDGSLGIPTSVGGEELARRVLTAELCANTRDMEASATPSSAPVTIPATGGAVSGNTQVWDYGVGCGSISVPTSNATTSTTSAPALGATTSDTAAQTLDAARISAISALVAAVRGGDPSPQILALASLPTGTSWPTSMLTPGLTTIGSAYDSSMTKAASTYLAARDQAARQQVSSLATSDGWPSAGALWSSISAANAAVVQVAAEPPGYTAPDPRAFENCTWVEGVEAGCDKSPVDGALAHLAATLDSEARAAGGPSPASLGAVGGGGDLLSRLTSPITTPLTNAMLNLAKANSTDPVGDIVSSGHLVVGASEVAIVGGAAVAAGAHNIISDAVGAGGAWDWASGWARIIIGTTYASGWTQAYLLPMLPEVHVLWLSIGWTIALLEGAIAIPVLAFLFIRLDGDELVGGVQRTGIIIAINICFRPILGILGLIGSYYVLPVAITLVTKYFPTAWFSAQSTHTVTIGGIIGAYVLLAYLQYQVCARVLGLVSEIPDRILRWWGSAGEGLHEGGHAAAAGAAMGAAAGLAGRAPGGGSSAPRKGGGGGGRGGTIRPAPTGGGSAEGGRAGEYLALPAPGAVGGGGEGADATVGHGSGAESARDDKWYAVDNMRPDHEDQARESYAKWAAGGGKYAYGDYVEYVRRRHRAGRGGEQS